jgi:hypothetical protein
MRPISKVWLKPGDWFGLLIIDLICMILIKNDNKVDYRINWKATNNKFRQIKYE